MMQADHDRYLEQLPWLVNGTLSDEESAELERHLESCAACETERRELLELQRVVRRPSVSTAGRGDFDALMQRIDEAPQQRSRHFVRLLILAQAAAIVVLAILAFAPDRTAQGDFRVLATDGSIAAGDYRILFADGVDEAEMRELLRALGAEIVSGPSSVGAYGLVATETLDLDALRQDRRVRMVERLMPTD